ncbi:MAG: tRNA guanosine(34) transglycosylase Tgt [Bacteroidota bacterium]
MTFHIQNTLPSGHARTGYLHTDHGLIETPIFMPVGTQGTVKALRQQDLIGLGAQIILGNTFHLYLRPGSDLISKAGGLHEFIRWDRPMLTDSGGYQVYSLSDLRKITEEGVKFRSPIDGSKHFFSPESATEIQQHIGADIIMAFDECTPYPCEEDYARRSMHMTHRWLERCLTYFAKHDGPHNYAQTLAPIVQGSTYPKLRVESAKYIADKGCTINAIGGLSVGEPAPIMYDMTALVCEHLPVDRARYLMGVGTPQNILECIDRGIDMFDCVMPSRNARHGLLYTAEGTINIKNAKWKDVFEPIDEHSTSALSREHTKAYLKHLYSVGEALGHQIATVHNLSFYLWLVKEARNHIREGDYTTWKSDMVQRLDRRL